MSRSHPDAGFGVNLTWTAIAESHEWLGYRKNGAVTDLAAMIGLSTVTVWVDLDSKT